MNNSINNNIKVLFADDSPETLSFLEFGAKSEGWEVVCVSSARGIIEAVNQACVNGGRCFDIIVADVNYFNEENKNPRITGITAAREVRRNHPNIPILFISAWISVLIREEARKLHGDILAKPFDWDMVMERIKYLIKWHREVLMSTYSGQERRFNSLNFGQNMRRDTDRRPISVPSVLEKAISEVRESRELKSYDKAH